MNRIYIFIIPLLSILAVSSKSYAQAEFPVLKGPYFGQELPGLTPKVFAPGIVSIKGRFEGGISFSPELDEMYFAASNEDEGRDIYFSKLENNQWAPIKRANFTNGRKKSEFHPFASPDGKRIYFTALNSSFQDEKIWYVNRLKDSWSDALKLDSPINDDIVFCPNQAKNGDLYYFNVSKFKTYYAPNKNGEFPEAQQIQLEIGHHAFISPSQDYLLVTAASNEDKNRKDNDIYVYFRNQDGTWSKPMNLGNAINSTADEVAPNITLDGKYLFFSRGADGENNIYWVSTEIIKNLKIAYFTKQSNKE